MRVSHRDRVDCIDCLPSCWRKYTIKMIGNRRRSILRNMRLLSAAVKTYECPAVSSISAALSPYLVLTWTTLTFRVMFSSSCLVASMSSPRSGCCCCCDEEESDCDQDILTEGAACRYRRGIRMAGTMHWLAFSPKLPLQHVFCQTHNQVLMVAVVS